MEPILRITKYSDLLHEQEAKMRQLLYEMQRQIGSLQDQKEAISECISSKREDVWNQERKLITLMETQNRLNTAMESLTSESSRLQYELVVQEEKLKEVEDAIDDLHARINRFRFPSLVLKAGRLAAVGNGINARRRDPAGSASSLEDITGSKAGSPDELNNNSSAGFLVGLDDSGSGTTAHWFWTFVSISFTLLHLFLIQIPLAVYESIKARFLPGDQDELDSPGSSN